MKIGKVLFWVAQKVNQREKTPSFCFVSKITSTTSHLFLFLFMTICYSKKKVSTRTRSEAFIHQTKAQKKNYDAIKFINNKTLSTFPWNKFDDDNFYQRWAVCMCARLRSQQKEKKNHIGWGNKRDKVHRNGTSVKWAFCSFNRIEMYADVCDVCPSAQKRKEKRTN